MCPSSWKLYVDDFPFFGSSLACLEPELELFEVWEINVRQIIIIANGNNSQPPFLAKYWYFLPISSHARPKTMQTRCLGGFPLCGYQDFCFLPKELGFLAQSRPGLASSFLPCWWVGWWLWRTCYISQDTYFLYKTFKNKRSVDEVNSYI